MDGELVTLHSQHKREALQAGGGISVMAPVPIEESTQIVAFQCRDTTSEVPPVLVTIRPIHHDDENRLLQFFDSHNSETIYLRYGYFCKSLLGSQAHLLSIENPAEHFGLIGLVSTPEGERVIALGYYCPEAQTNFAEVAFVVHENYRHLGIASYLLARLAEIIRAHGFAGITATVLATNVAMIQVFREVLGSTEDVTCESGQFFFRWHFDSAEQPSALNDAARKNAARNVTQNSAVEAP